MRDNPSGRRLSAAGPGAGLDRFAHPELHRNKGDAAC
jgi:hypothetical protein